MHVSRSTSIRRRAVRAPPRSDRWACGLTVRNPVWWWCVVAVGMVAAGPFAWWLRQAVDGGTSAEQRATVDYLWDPPALTGSERLVIGLG